MAGLAVPMIKKKISRNKFYGFRTAKTLSNDEIWYKANHFAGKALFAAGVVMIISSFLLYLLGGNLEVDPLNYVTLALGMVPLAIAFVASGLYLRKL